MTASDVTPAARLDTARAAAGSISDAINGRGLSSFQWKLLVLCFLVALFDGFDTQAVAFTGPAIIDAMAMSTASLAPLLTAGTAGMAVGAMGLGLIGDRFGRKPALLGAITIFGLASLATAFAQTPEQIFVLRVLAGLGMGGATPVLLALAAEYGPARSRGAITTGVLLALPAGAMLGGILAAEMLPSIGWQGIYAVGGVVPLVLIVVLYFSLPESMHFLANRGKTGDDQRIAKTLSRILGRSVQPSEFSVDTESTPERTARLSALFADGFARNTVAVWGTYLFNWIGWFMLLSWLPTVLREAGLASGSAPLGSVVVNAAFIVFAFPLAYFLPRLSTSRILVFMFACGIVIAMGLGLAVSGSNWTLAFVLIAAAGFGIGGQQLALNYLVVSAYPAALRATATGWAIGIGRVGAIIGSAIGGTFLALGGVSGFFYALAVPLFVAACCVFLIRKAPESGQSVA